MRIQQDTELNSMGEGGEECDRQDVQDSGNGNLGEGDGEGGFGGRSARCQAHEMGKEKRRGEGAGDKKLAGARLVGRSGKEAAEVDGVERGCGEGRDGGWATGRRWG